MSNQILWYTTRGAGAVSLVLLTLVVVLGVLSSLRVQAAGWPRFLTPALHRNVALMTVVFTGLHVVTAVIDPFTSLGWMAAVVPFSSYYRTFWLGLGTISAELVAAIVVTSLLRRYLGRTAWRAVHWLAYASWPVGLLHSFGTGTDAWSPWLVAIGIACAAAVGFAVVYRLMAGAAPDPLAEPRASFRQRAERRTQP
jgi:methionine sulfoxide reductase heme-binding subunit